MVLYGLVMVVSHWGAMLLHGFALGRHHAWRRMRWNCWSKCRRDVWRCLEMCRFGASSKQPSWALSHDCRSSKRGVASKTTRRHWWSSSIPSAFDDNSLNIKTSPPFNFVFFILFWIPRMLHQFVPNSQVESACYSGSNICQTTCPRSFGEGTWQQVQLGQLFTDRFAKWLFRLASWEPTCIDQSLCIFVSSTSEELSKNDASPSQNHLSLLAGLPVCAGGERRSSAWNCFKMPRGAVTINIHSTSNNVF